jgi:hypothetical protein
MKASMFVIATVVILITTIYMVYPSIKTSTETFVAQPLIISAGVKGDIGPKGDKGDMGSKGDKGDPGVSISSIQTNQSNLIITLSDGRTQNIPIQAAQGSQGSPGVGIQSIANVNNELVITLTDGTKRNIIIPSIKGDPGPPGPQGPPGLAQFANNTWIKSADGQNRLNMTAAGRTYLGAPNGFEFKNAQDGKIAEINKEGDGYFSRNLVVDGASFVKGDGNFSKNVSVEGTTHMKGDMVFNGTNQWLLHTPDDGRRDMYITPRKTDNTDWDWTKDTIHHGDGSMTVKNKVNSHGVTVTPNDPGAMIEKAYPGNHKYGLGQYPNGQVKVYAAQPHTPASVSLSMAKADGSFDDRVTATNNGVLINGATSVTGNTTITGNAIVTGDSIVKNKVRAGVADSTPMPNGWGGGGVVAFDMYSAGGSIAAGDANGNIKALMNKDGDAKFTRNLEVGGETITQNRVVINGGAWGASFNGKHPTHIRGEVIIENGNGHITHFNHRNTSTNYIRGNTCIRYGDSMNYELCLQGDGNIVQYKDGAARWSTGR